MIDIESYVYTQVRNAVKAVYPNASLSGEYVENPSSFPHVCVEMSDNVTHVDSMTATKREFAAEQTFTVNIYTNTQTAKTDAKKLLTIVDGVLSGMGFRRAMYLQTPNIEHTIYRLTLRYTGLVATAYDEAQGHYNIIAR